MEDRRSGREGVVDHQADLFADSVRVSRHVRSRYFSSRSVSHVCGGSIILAVGFGKSWVEVEVGVE